MQKFFITLCSRVMCLVSLTMQASEKTQTSDFSTLSGLYDSLHTNVKKLETTVTMINKAEESRLKMQELMSNEQTQLLNEHQKLSEDFKKLHQKQEELLKTFTSFREGVNQQADAASRIVLAENIKISPADQNTPSINLNEFTLTLTKKHEEVLENLNRLNQLMIKENEDTLKGLWAQNIQIRGGDQNLLVTQNLEETILGLKKNINEVSDCLHKYKQSTDNSLTKITSNLKECKNKIAKLCFPSNLDKAFAGIEGILAFSTLVRLRGLAPLFGELVAPLSHTLYSTPYLGKLLSCLTPTCKYGWSYIGVGAGIPLIITIFGAKCVYDIKQNKSDTQLSHINFTNICTAGIRNLLLVAHSILPTDAKGAVSCLVMAALLATWYKNK